MNKTFRTYIYFIQKISSIKNHKDDTCFFFKNAPILKLPFKSLKRIWTIISYLSFDISNSHWNKNGRVKLVLKKRKILLLHFLIIINVLDLAVISSIYSQFLKDMDISTRKSKTIAEHLSNKISPRSRQLSRTDGLNSLHWLLIAQFYYNTKTSNFIHIKASSY